MTESCARCGKQAAHMHHRKLRSQLGDDSPANLIPLCADCHGWVHAHPGQAYEEGWLVYSWADPKEVPIQLTIEGKEVPHDTYAVGGQEKFGVPVVYEPHPGETCGLCKRRVPHPKKATSPKTKTTSYRIPLDDAETHEEIAQAAAEVLGIHDKPHWRWALNNYAYGLILQGARLEEGGA